jgi:hypothetical protein
MIGFKNYFFSGIKDIYLLSRLLKYLAIYQTNSL